MESRVRARMTSSLHRFCTLHPPAPPDTKQMTHCILLTLFLIRLIFFNDIYKLRINCLIKRYLFSENLESSTEQKSANKKYDFKKYRSVSFKVLFVLLIIIVGITFGLCVKVIFATFNTICCFLHSK